MALISLKDYAKQSNISYEAVRQQVNRYRDELVQHIVKDGRQQFLDEMAVEFLDSKRDKNPVVVIQQDKDDLIASLESENKGLLIKVADLQERLIKEKEERLMLVEKVSKVELLQAGKEEAERKAAETALELDDVRARAEKAEKENEVLISKKIDVELALTAAEKENKTLEDVAEMHAQEAEEAKARAEREAARASEAEAELERLRKRGFWARLWNKE